MRILAGTDFLPKSEFAVERAGLLADSLKAELTLVHAVPQVATDGYTLEERLHRAGTMLSACTSQPSWRWKSRPALSVLCGQPARVLRDIAIREAVHLVVLGPHRIRTFADALNGTITENLLGAAGCPVLVARRSPQDSYRRVLLALDNSPTAGRVVRAVESLGLLQAGHATVIHAHEPSHALTMDTVAFGLEDTVALAEKSRNYATARVNAVLEQHSENHLRYEVQLVERRPTEAILDSVEQLNPDLLVLGTRGHGRFRRALLGSVASNVLRAAQCDVLLVPPSANTVQARAAATPALVRGRYRGHGFR